ncbi:serpentine type 7TM GPCR chemoreceptor str domain-containing protein [Ditylenchus destructor]|nr:serpentine type 7TM GPCR chemoreceptor str domain-containing protein [Ditylenchus destructor]
MEIASYSIIVICGLKIRKFVKQATRAGQHSRRTIEVNRQLSLVLFLQALLPIIELSIPMMCMLISTFSGTRSSVYAVVYAYIPFHWVPVLNPLITIFVVKPYRNFIFGRGSRRRINSITPTVTASSGVLPSASSRKQRSVNPSSSSSSQIA